MSLNIEGITAGYRGHPVLKEVTVTALEPGKLTGFIGPNASGKSTLFKTVAGLLRSTQGRIELAGSDLVTFNRKERARAVAYMPQSFQCNALLTVFESVLLALKQTSGWRVRSDNLHRVSETLASLHLSDLAARGIADLSGGQTQMVAVAQALVRRPDVILLDEPTSALDIHHQLSVLSLIRAEGARRRPVVMVALHDLNLAARFCDRLVLLRDGCVLADGAPEIVLALPEIGETYRVETDLEHTRRGALYLDVRLQAEKPNARLQSDPT